jgi:hypothetical protein
MERETGLEPATSSLGSWHSTTELLPLVDDPRTYLIQELFPSEVAVYTVYRKPSGQIQKRTVRRLNLPSTGRSITQHQVVLDRLHLVVFIWYAARFASNLRTTARGIGSICSGPISVRT